MNTFYNPVRGAREDDGLARAVARIRLGQRGQRGQQPRRGLVLGQFHERRQLDLLGRVVIGLLLLGVVIQGQVIRRRRVNRGPDRT